MISAGKRISTEDTPIRVKPSVDSEILSSILPSTLDDSHVYVHCRCTNRGEDLLIRIWKTTFLVDRQALTRSALIHADNITLAPNWTLVPGHTTHTFLLIFSSLPASCRQFDLVEEIPQPGGFEVRNIARNERDVYHINIL
jgi:hypothetical protein